jgi:hypothetical protein
MVLGRCGGAPAGRTRASNATRERGAALAPKHGHPPCQSASARKSERTHTRVRLPPETRKAGSVDGTPGTPAALARGVVRLPLAYQNLAQQTKMTVLAISRATAMSGFAWMINFLSIGVGQPGLIESLRSVRRWSFSPVVRLLCWQQSNLNSGSHWQRL